MKTLVIYYSHSGNTKKIAEAEAAGSGSDICEIKTAGRLGIFRGIPKAMRGRTTEIQPLSVDLSEYDTIKLYEQMP